VIGRSQVETGLIAIIAPIAGRLADRYPAGILGGIGLGVLSLGFILLALLPAQPGDASIIWRIVVCGFGFFQSPNNRAIVSNAPRERSGGAGAIQATARLLGQTIGAALVALVFGYAGPGGGTSPTTAILIAAAFRRLPRSPASPACSISCGSRDVPPSALPACRIQTAIESRCARRHKSNRSSGRDPLVGLHRGRV
jgi:MFS family permease